MLDLVLGALLVGLGIRGWMRGLVKEVISLVVLIVGTVAAFRLSTPLGRVIANMSGVSPTASRYVAGIIIFFALAIAAAVISRVLHLGMRFLPGVSTLNRAGGAALSLLAFTLVVTLLVSLATVIDLPEAAAEQLEESSVAAALTEPDGTPQRVLGFLSGDRVMEITLRIREVTGGDQAVALPGSPLDFPPTSPSDLERLPGVEDVMFDLLNRERVEAEADPVARSAGLDQIAFDTAMQAYASGRATVPTDDELREVLNVAGLPSTSRSMAMVLAASPEAAHDALVSAVGDQLLPATSTKAGIAVLQGPMGLLVVEILAG